MANDLMGGRVPETRGDRFPTPTAAPRREPGGDGSGLGMMAAPEATAAISAAAWTAAALADRLADYGADERRLAAEQALVAADEDIDAVFRVADGLLIAYADRADGMPRITALYFPGDMVLPGGPDATRGEAIAATVPSRLIAYPLDAVKRACAAEPDIGYALFETACAEISRRLRDEVALRAMTVEERLAAVLLEMGGRIGTPLGTGLEVVLPVTRAQIGSYLNLRSETICRIFARWKRRGWIALRGRRVIELRRPDELRGVIGSAKADS